MALVYICLKVFCTPAFYNTQILFDTNHFPGDGEEFVRRVGGVGPRQKPWDLLGPQQKRKQSQQLFDKLKKTSKERDVHPIRMVGSLLQRYFFVHYISLIYIIF